MVNTLRDSVIPMETIDAWVRQNPCKYHPEKQDIILTCPVRIGFVHLDEPQKNTNDNGDENETYNLVAIFPPQATAQVDTFLKPIWAEMSMRDFPKFVYEGQPTDSVHNPFYDQKKKIQYSGYTAGAYFLNVGSKHKPGIIDANMQPIPPGPGFKERLYDGCWCILGIRPYAFGKAGQSKNKGVKFGLVAVMLLSDDTKFVGQGPKAEDVFAGVAIERTFNPDAAFNSVNTSAPQAPPQSSIVPASGPTGSAAPAAYTPPAQWPQGFPPDQMVAAGWGREALLAAGYSPVDLAHYGVV